MQSLSVGFFTNVISDSEEKVSDLTSSMLEKDHALHHHEEAHETKNDL